MHSSSQSTRWLTIPAGLRGGEYPESSLTLDFELDHREPDPFLSVSIPQQSVFPSPYFLDHDMFEYSGVGLPTTYMQLHAKVLEAFNMLPAISARYFSWAHLWMPIISKSKWSRITGPLAQPTADVKLLLFAMKLLLWSPPNAPQSRDPRHEDYMILRAHLLEAENLGLLSLELLQVRILMTIYEYSHAIYPAAFISIGICTRYGLALGIDKQRQVDLDALRDSIEVQEDKRRVWWSVIILHRMISRSSTGPEPRADDLLPVHDQAWDDGVIDSSRIYPVSVPSTTDTGMLARLAQAAFLLGRVYRWKNYPTGDAQFDHAEKIQLDRALRALVNLTYEEGATRLMPICPQTALCFSALVTLHDHDTALTPFTLSKSETLTMDMLQDTAMQRDSLNAITTLQFLRPIAQESSMSTNLFFRREPWSMEKSSPLLLHWTYLIAMSFLKIANCLRMAQASDDFEGLFLRPVDGRANV